jgi:hypothetical protein
MAAEPPRELDLYLAWLETVWLPSVVTGEMVRSRSSGTA